mgnify:CR=1 FL=1
MAKENKVSNSFNQAIKAMLNERAASDPLFAKAYQREGKSIEECCNYIVSEVQRMGVNALTDEEVLGLAVHYYDEVDIKVGKVLACQVVVPATPEVAEARKVELQREAEERFIEEQIKKMQAPAKKIKRTMPVTTDTPTLF